MNFFLIFLLLSLILHDGLCKIKKPKSLLPKNCGQNIASDRIVGGENAKLGEFPWIAQLIYKVGKEKVAACGGTLISRKYVVTAAHCLPVYAVRVGEFNTKTKVDCERKKCAPKMQEIKVEKNIKHANYSKAGFVQDDIALLRLKKSAVFNDYVSPICLPSTNIVTPRDKFQAAGWGLVNSTTRVVPKVLQKVSLDFVRPELCQKAYNKFNYEINRNTQMCAAGEGNQDTCDGDSGGPLMTIKDNDEIPRYYLAGIVSFGTSVCGSGLPGVYTKVSSYYNWIVDNMKP